MIRMFIGSSSNGEDCTIEAAYEYSLRKHTDEEIDITWMRQTSDENDVWYHNNTGRWSTPFSGYRWFIPEHCNFKGRAIYTDCDMINFKDINELWETDLKGKPIAARKGFRFDGHEFCVMVIDCEAIKDHLIPISRQKNISSYHQRMIGLFSGNENLVEELDPRWNCLDGEDYELDDIWHLHYTNMATQPWRPDWYVGPKEDHPRKDIEQLYYTWVQEATTLGGYGFYKPGRLIEDYGIIGQ